MTIIFSSASMVVSWDSSGSSYIYLRLAGFFVVVATRAAGAASGVPVGACLVDFLLGVDAALGRVGQVRCSGCFRCVRLTGYYF